MSKKDLMPPMTVLGAGAWGTALAVLLAKNGRAVRLWGRDARLMEEIRVSRRNNSYLKDITLPEQIEVCGDWEQLWREPQEVLIAVPSYAFTETVQKLKKHHPLIQGIVWATKGLEPETGAFLHQVIARELGENISSAALSGPSFAGEVAMGLPTAVALAGGHPQFNQKAATYFCNETFKVYTHTDLFGVQLGGVVKNILALAVGVADGLQCGANGRAALISLGIAEMFLLGQALGAAEETLLGPAGCGDIILSCTDDRSRNRQLGLRLAAGQSVSDAMGGIGKVTEAVHNVAALCCLAESRGVKMALVEQVGALLRQESAPRDILRPLLATAS